MVREKRENGCIIVCTKYILTERFLYGLDERQAYKNELSECFVRGSDAVLHDGCKFPLHVYLSRFGKAGGIKAVKEVLA